jgi:hypothetical protein
MDSDIQRKRGGGYWNGYCCRFRRFRDSELSQVTILCPETTKPRVLHDILLGYRYHGYLLIMLKICLKITSLSETSWRLKTLREYSESESYITTDSQSASLSWNKATIWGLWPDIYLSLTITALFLWASSLTRGRVWLLYMLLALTSVVFLGSESLGTRDHILLSQIWDFPFRRLLRLAGSRWRYSTPPPHRVARILFCALIFGAVRSYIQICSVGR